MDTLKKLAGVLTFFVVFILSVAVTRYLHTPFKTAARVSRIVPSSPQVFEPQAAAGLASSQVNLVSLDFETRKSYTTLTLKRDLDQPVPESLWVRTYFFRSGGSRIGWFTDMAEIRQPFKNGDTVTLTAAAPCRWCNRFLAPISNFYARVQISTRSVNDPILHENVINDDITTAIPVLLQNERRQP